MPSTPSTVLRRAVGVVKLGVAAVLASLAVGPALVATQDVVAERAPAPITAPGSSATDAAAVAKHDRLDRLMVRHECSTTGLGADVIPGSALIERDDRVQHVSFDEGWEIFTGDASGELLAVCRGTV